LKLNSNITFREVDDEIIILNLENDQYYSLNKSGTQIFKKIVVEKGNIQEFARSVAAENNVPYTAVLQDAADLIAELKKEKIVLSDDSEV